MTRRPSRPTLFPYTTLFRSLHPIGRGDEWPELLFRLRFLQEIDDPAAVVETHDAEARSEEHTSELQSRQYLVCRLLLEKKKALHRYPEFVNRQIIERLEPNF